MISKSDLRKKILLRRKQLDLKKLSYELCENIKHTNYYKNAKNIFAYYPMKYEIDIKELLKDNSKNWFLPKTDNLDMNFYPYKCNDELQKSDFGVYEPISNEKIDIIPDLIIVPSLCVDKNGYRLGYGKGFYDRFLDQKQYKNVITITPICSNFVIDDTFNELHDKKIDIIITEKSFIQ